MDGLRNMRWGQGVRLECPINPFSLAVRRDPYPTYAWLRRDYPVCWSKRGSWFLFRHDDVADLLKDPQYDHWDMGAPGAFSLSPQELAMKRCLELLAPHGSAYLRGQIARALSGERLAALENDLREVAGRLMTHLTGRPAFDVIADFAVPLTVRTTGARLGAAGGTLDALVAMLRTTGSLLGLLPVVERRQGDPLARLISDIVEHRRVDRGDDLCSAMWNAVDAGDRISAGEIADLLVFVLYAGCHNTTNFIGLAAAALMDQGDSTVAVSVRNGLANHAVDELLRFDGPVQYIRMTARERVHLRGQDIESGEALFVCVGSANRDPEAFDEPDRLDLARVPSGQLGFGRGALQCIGAAMARRQGAAGLRALFAHPVKRRDDSDDTVNFNSPVLRGLDRLTVE
jgi:cytochrome P450